MARETAAQRRARYQDLLADPNARTALDLIAAAEGVAHGYNTMFGNTVIDSLADHPRERRGFTQTDGQANQTSAAGRYQFLESTWDDAARAIGASDFGPENQDLAALYLIDRAGALDPVVRGDFASALPRLGSTWASLPSSPYAQPRRSQEFVNDFLLSHGYDNQSQAPLPEVQQPQQASPPMLAATSMQRDYDAAIENDLADQVSSILQREMAVPDLTGDAPVLQPSPALAALVGEQAATGRPAFEPWGEQLMAGALDDEVAQMRQNAVSSFFGEDPIARIQLPEAIEQAISQTLENL